MRPCPSQGVELYGSHPTTPLAHTQTLSTKIHLLLPFADRCSSETPNTSFVQMPPSTKSATMHSKALYEIRVLRDRM